MEEKIVFSTINAGQLEIHVHKKEAELHLPPYTKLNSK